MVEIPFNLSHEAQHLEMLMNQYASVPMSFADACLVRMSELIKHSQIISFDSDFLIYRQHQNQIIPLLMPDS